MLDKFLFDPGAMLSAAFCLTLGYGFGKIVLGILNLVISQTFMVIAMLFLSDKKGDK